LFRLQLVRVKFTSSRVGTLWTTISAQKVIALPQQASNGALANRNPTSAGLLRLFFIDTASFDMMSFFYAEAAV